MNGQQIKETELVRNLRDHKMELSISRFAFELLLSFLHERKYLLLLSIINVRLSVKGYHLTLMNLEVIGGVSFAWGSNPGERTAVCAARSAR